MNNLINPELAVRLVLTLAHFLWEGLAVAILAALSALALRHARAALRFQVYFASLLLMVLALALTFACLAPTASPTVAISGPISPRVVQPVAASPQQRTSPAQPMLSGQPAQPTPQTARLSLAPIPNPVGSPPVPPLLVVKSPTQPPLAWKPYAALIVELYAAGVLFMLLRLSIAISGGRRLRAAARPITDAAILAALARQATRLGLRVAPLASYSARVLVPTVVGIFKPAILLPMSLASGLGPEALELILAHELAHVRRYDHLLHLLQRLIEAALFFHPAVWYLSRQIDAERENACDDLAAGASENRQNYALALLQAAQLCTTARRLAGTDFALAMADRPGTLRHRILRLIEPTGASRFRLPGVWTFSVVLIAATLIAIGSRQHANAAGNATTRPAAPAATRPSGIAATQPSYTLSGTVTDAQGCPVSRAFVGPADKNIWLAATSDAAGRFVLKDVPAGQRHFFVFSQRLGRMAAFSLAAPQTRDVGSITLNCYPADVKGRVITSSGVPIEGAQVELHLIGPDKTVYTLAADACQKTDASGRYACGSLPAAEGFSLSVCLHGEPAHRHQTPPLQLGRQFLIELPDLVTDDLPPAKNPGPTQVRYSGRVLDVDTHQPIAGVKL